MPFQPSFMFVSKALAYLSESTFRVGYAPDLNHKQTTMEMSVRDKIL
jgi:hypothetical protein